MNKYRNVFHRPVEGLEPGDEGELDLTPEQESDYLRQGRLEIVAADYEVVGPRAVFGNAPGAKFSMSLTAGQEFNLVESGHIERVQVKPSRQRKADKE